MMFEIFREFQQDIDLPHFKKKFENMRTSYGRELKKVNASKQTGTGSDDVYKPSLWYYKLFDFCEGISEPSRRGIDTLDDVKEVIQNLDSNELSGSQLTDQHSNSTQSLELNHPSSSQPIKNKRPNPNMSQEATTPRKKQMSRQNKQEKLVDTAQKVLKSSSDDWQVIGQSIGLQLKDLNKHQLIFVKKIISDAIYYGRLEKLTEHSSNNLGNPPAHFPTRYMPNNLISFSQTPPQLPLFIHHPLNINPTLLCHPLINIKPNPLCLYNPLTITPNPLCLPLNIKPKPLCLYNHLTITPNPLHHPSW